PDGSPAVGATVRSYSGYHEPSVLTHTDGTGRFQFQGMFGNGCNLHASSADGRHQTVTRVPSIAARTVFTTPLEVTLAPALAHEVRVLSEGRPVAGVQVVGGGPTFRV